MGKRLPEVATSDIATLATDKSEVGALALITLDPKRYVAEVFQSYRTKLVALVEASDAAKLAKPDLRTVAGMEIAIKHRAGFRDELRIAGEETRVERKAPLLSIGKLLDSEYKEVAAEALPHETYWDGEIKAEEARKKAEKAEKARIEAERAAAIRTKIAEISSLPAKHVRATAAELTDALRELATREIMPEEFAEQTDDARAAVDTAAAELIALRDAATASEAAALAAEEARKAEVARIEQERATLAAQRIENERIANEQAVERQRLADLAAAQEAEARRIREQAAANLKAEQDALAEQVRLQREAAAEQQRQMAAQQAEFEAQRAAFAREQEETRQHIEDALKMEADRAEALWMDVQFDADREAERARLQAAADQHLADTRAQPAFSATQINESMIAYAESHSDDPEVTDKEIMAIAAELGLTPDAWVERLTAFCERMTSITPTGQRYSRTTFKDNGAAIFLNEDGSRSIFCDLDD